MLPVYPFRANLYVTLVVYNYTPILAHPSHLRVHPENSFRISPGIPEFVYKKVVFSPVGGWGIQSRPETFGIDAYAYWDYDACCSGSSNSSGARRRVQSKREPRNNPPRTPRNMYFIGVKFDFLMIFRFFSRFFMILGPGQTDEGSGT